MRKVLAGDLSATWNLDGGHLDRFIGRRRHVVSSLCEQVLLHDQVMVPTHDYLTACGFIRLIGEGNLISLLEKNELRFVRLRSVFGYVRGTGPEGGLAVFAQPNGKTPRDCSIDESIEAAFRATGQMIERKKLSRLLVEQSYAVETVEALDYIRQDAFRDLRQTSLWDDSYDDSKLDLLRLPGMEEMQVKVLGPTTDASANVVDALLGLTLANIELYLAEKFECAATSTGAPIGDAVALKVQRLSPGGEPHRLWSFLQNARVPDPSSAILADRALFRKLMKIRRSRNGVAFREWFSALRKLDEREIVAAYIDLLHERPLIQSAPSKALRLVTTMGVDALGGMGLGAAASAIDTYVIDRILRGTSPRYFVEDLRKFSGHIAAQQSRRVDERTP